MVSLVFFSVVTRPVVDVACEDTTERGQVKRPKSVHAFQYMTESRFSREGSAVSQLLAISWPASARNDILLFSVTVTLDVTHLSAPWLCWTSIGRTVTPFTATRCPPWWPRLKARAMVSRPSWWTCLMWQRHFRGHPPVRISTCVYVWLCMLCECSCVHWKVFHWVHWLPQTQQKCRNSRLLIA